MGRVVATLGRRVEVEDPTGGRRVCFLSGQRAVIGDQVTFERSGEDEGKLVDVKARHSVLMRADFKGREQEIAANLGGLLVVASCSEPVYRPGLIDRYLIAASLAGVDVALVLGKIDLGVPPEVVADVAWREANGLPVFRVSVRTGDGIAALASFLAERAQEGPWAFVGHSGVGKTALAGALLPEVDVGPIGEISAFWDAGRHTTTASRIYPLPGGGEIADSPGIRTFLPAGLTPETVRLHFPFLPALACRYRNCLHRPGEDGCRAEVEVEAELLLRYRRVLDEVVDVKSRARY